ncbi:hypothetical protein Pmani_003693 [Petrolisthes manimaculis]|uniref:Uncharacterized protein n=1 Tax=Petrolisthes manimaculis TaxID=1843537 RepID=A0AAE1QGB7_9EUCA|nr:hypothetical protein Pmani_003693 [Petrolisthes manimaculis]
MSVIAMGLVLWTFRFLLARVSEVGVAYMSLQKLIFNMFRSLVIQSNRLPTVNWPLRIIIAAWYLYCYYIYGEVFLGPPTRCRSSKFPSSCHLVNHRYTVVRAIPSSLDICVGFEPPLHIPSIMPRCAIFSLRLFMVKAVFQSGALYSGTLTAVLAIPAYERPLDTLSEVLEATKQGIIPVVIRESSVHYIFQVGTHREANG